MADDDEVIQPEPGAEVPPETPPEQTPGDNPPEEPRAEDPGVKRVFRERDEYRERAAKAERDAEDTRRRLAQLEQEAEERNRNSPDAIKKWNEEFATDPYAVHTREIRSLEQRFEERLAHRESYAAMERVWQGKPEPEAEKIQDELAKLLEEEYPNDREGRKTPLSQQYRHVTRLYNRINRASAAPRPGKDEIVRTPPGGGKGRAGGGEPTEPAESRKPSEADIKWASEHFHDEPDGSGRGKGQRLWKSWKGKGWVS